MVCISHLLLLGSLARWCLNRLKHLEYVTETTQGSTYMVT
jgi:hypothetical protein